MATDLKRQESRRRLAAVAFLSNISLDGTTNREPGGSSVKYYCVRNCKDLHRNNVIENQSNGSGCVSISNTPNASADSIAADSNGVAS